MDYANALEVAICYIGISKKTEYEVRQKLIKKKVEAHIIDKVIEYLKELNYINDKAYVDAYIVQNMRLLKYSIKEITYKLLQKGIKKDIMEDKLIILAKKDYENKVIKKIINSKGQRLDELKLKGYIYRRGFKDMSLFLEE